MYNFIMRLEARNQVKLMLMMRNMTITKLAQLLSEKTGKGYTRPNLSGKLKRDSLSYNEVLAIAEILEYKIEFVDVKEY